MTLWQDVARELATLGRRLRPWAWSANHQPCPVCAEHISPGHQWQVHKLRHGPIAWQTAISREQA